jgi:hypothetical protein
MTPPTCLLTFSMPAAIPECVLGACAIADSVMAGKTEASPNPKTLSSFYVRTLNYISGSLFGLFLSGRPDFFHVLSA